MPEPKLSESFSRALKGDPPCDDDGGETCGDGNVCRYGRCEAAISILPPDFTVNRIRSGATASEIYRVIAAGIPGTAMPQWKDSIPDEDIWAIAHYVQHLAGLAPTASQKIWEKVRRSGNSAQ